MSGRSQGSFRRLLRLVLPGLMAMGAAASLTGCGLTMNQDPRQQAISRIQGACEQLARADVETALDFIELTRESETPGTGNLALLLEAIPELASIGDDRACLDAFLDGLEPVN